MSANTVAVMAMAYLVGSIPWGWLIGIFFYGVELRRRGSRGIGATNVGRVLGKKPAVATFLLDTGKGLVIVLGARYFLANQDLATAAGLFGAVGHIFPPFLGGKGGRAVALSLGALLGLQWQVGVIAFGVWLVVVLSTRYVSLASILAAASMVGMECWWRLSVDSLLTCYLFMVLGILVIGMHIPHMGRLCKGEEKKFSFAARKVKGAPANG